MGIRKSDHVLNSKWKNGSIRVAQRTSLQLARRNLETPVLLEFSAKNKITNDFCLLQKTKKVGESSKTITTRKRKRKGARPS